MNKPNPFIRILTTTIALTALSGAALADATRAVPYAGELDACVSALKANIDMDGVRRIRHIVTKMVPESIGYSMKLETVTYTGDTERHYSASCFANGNNPPFKLRINEQGS